MNVFGAVFGEGEENVFGEVFGANETPTRTFGHVLLKTRVGVQRDVQSISARGRVNVRGGKA